jgi:hypothetical protein
MVSTRIDGVISADVRNTGEVYGVGLFPQLPKGGFSWPVSQPLPRKRHSELKLRTLFL